MDDQAELDKQLASQSSAIPSDGFPERMQIVAGLMGNAAMLSKATGISRRAIGDYFSGSSEPSRARLIAIASAANVRLEWLVAGSGPMRDEGSISTHNDGGALVDSHLLGRLTDGIVKLYKEMGQGIALHQAVEKAVELHDEIVSVTDPDDDGGRAGAMAVILARLRKELRAAAANPIETKRLA